MSEITDTLQTSVDNPVSGIDQSNGNFKYDMTYDFDAGTGLNERTVDYISAGKKEAPWIHEFRQKALKTFLAKPLPTHWASKDLETLNFDKIRYYLSQGQKPKRTWDEVPADIKRTFERLGVPEQASIAESQSTNSEDQARRIAVIAHANNLRRLVIVSDGTHLFRIHEICAADGLAVLTSPRSTVAIEGSTGEFERYIHEILSYTAWRLGLH